MGNCKDFLSRRNGWAWHDFGRVARKNPFPKREWQICQRLRRFREHRGYTRQKFAEIAKIDSQAIANYEQGKAQINYGAAQKIIKAYGLSARWLATGDEPMFSLRSFIPSPEVLRVGPRAPFSVVFDTVLSKGELELEPDEDDRRLYLEWCIKSSLETWISRSPVELLDYIAKEFSDLAEKLGQLRRPPTDIRVLEREERLRKKRPFIAEVVRIVTAHDSKMSLKQGEIEPRKVPSQSQTLTEHFQSESIVPVKLPRDLAELRQRLLKKTEVRGDKAMLAEYLSEQLKKRVRLSDVSRWLSGDRIPDGETTLRLIEWVHSLERKQ